MRGWTERAGAPAFALLALGFIVGCGAASPTVPTSPPEVPVTHEQLRAAVEGAEPLPEGALRLDAEALDLRGVLLDPSAWSRLERVDLSRVRTVRLGPPAIRAEDVDRLCRMPGLAAVTELSIDAGIDMGDGAEAFGSDGAARVAACPALRGLHTLRLVNGTLDDRALTALAAADWPALTTLDLHVNDIGPAGVTALAQSPLAARLQRLDLERNPIGDAGALALIDSGLLGRATVAFGHAELSDAVAEAVLRLDRVHALSLDGAHFSDEAFERLRAKFGDRVELP